MISTATVDPLVSLVAPLIEPGFNYQVARQKK
jgi:hypothetical protein